MSGVEGLAALALVTGTITLVRAAKDIYGAAKDVHGLPEAFRKVEGRLPIVESVLVSVKQNIETDKLGEDIMRGVKPVLESCQQKADKLNKLFNEALPAGGTSDFKRYCRAVKTYGKGNEVQKLMKGILEDVQILHCERGLKMPPNKAQEEEIAVAIEEVDAIPCSVPDHEFQQSELNAHHSGTGNQYNSLGDQSNSEGGPIYNSSGGPMNFGKE